jgi:hypothetical protein
MTIMRRILVLAARVEDGQDHQIRIREQPLPGLCARSLSRLRQSSEMFILSHRAEVILADPRQARNLVLGKEFLARLDSDHDSCLSVSSMLTQA